MIRALLGAIAALGGLLWVTLRRLDKAKDRAKKGEAHEEMRKLENDAAIQDDVGLADRITRGGV